jgi:hypothetical protein
MKNAPKCGTLTGMVWEKCEMLVAELDRTPTRGELVKWGTETGMNLNTVTTQYQEWKKYTGRTGPTQNRVAVTVVRVTG